MAGLPFSWREVGEVRFYGAGPSNLPLDLRAMVSGRAVRIAPLTVTPFHRYQFTCVRRPARSLSEYLPDAIASGGPQWSVGWLSRPAEAECTDARPEAGAVPETV